MYQVLDKIKVGNTYSTSVEGDIQRLKNGVKLRDENGNIYRIETVGMTHFVLSNVNSRRRYADIVLSGEIENIGRSLEICG